MGHSNPITKRLKIIDLDDDTQVNSGGNANTKQLQPNSGKIYQVLGVEYNAPDPVGSTSGYHSLEMRNNDGTNTVRHLKGSSNTGKDLDFYYWYWTSVDTAQTTDKAANAQISQNMFATYDVPMDFYYFNNTDANQTGTRTLKVLVLETSEG